MEVSSSAITGAMRVGVQVVNSHKRPLLEVYHQVHNKFSPEQENIIDYGGGAENRISTQGEIVN
ncbi:hypothetical protein, partial [Vibrio breoganii]|uniref:hypothetical protein n=1 Tax=Vibrio breoganii TaxID=553239 RepID=UPI0010BDD141